MWRSSIAVLLVGAMMGMSVDGAAMCQRVVKDAVAPPPAMTKDELAELAWFPQQFDWCEQGYCTPTREVDASTSACGACFLHAALASAQDRIKIQGKTPGDAAPALMLNRQSFLNCAPTMGLSMGCGGGAAEDVFEFMHLYGLPDEKCLPYSGTDHNKFQKTYGSCPPEAFCATTGKETRPEITRYRAQEHGRISGEYAIIKELLRGPVTCSIASTEALENTYKSGVFEDTTGTLSVTHDVEIVGWGEENGIKFWNVRNSLGPQWGDHGFFKLVRGKNNLGIETDCHFVVPEFVDDEVIFVEKAVSAGGSLWSIVAFGQEPPETAAKDEATPAPQVKPAEKIPTASQPAQQPFAQPVAQPVVAAGAGDGASTSWIDNLTSIPVVVTFLVLLVVIGGAFIVRAYRQRRSQGYLPLR